MSSFQAILDPVKEGLREVHNRIREVIQTDEPMIKDHLAALIDRPGKMIRPALVLLSGKACSGLRREHIDLGAIVELIHSATLLHDDVIDQASIRRNCPCANALWGNTAAVLLGDFLLTRALMLGTKVNLPGIPELLLKTAEDICQGELLQNLHRGNWELTEEQYFRIIDGKTAALFVCSSSLGTLASGADEKTTAPFEAYSRSLGRAFQIRDDLLDLLGSEEACGKTLGTDLTESKLTLPLIRWLKSLPDQQQQQEKQHLSEKTDRTRIQKDIRKSGAVESVRQTIRQLCEKACKSLDTIENSSAKDTLLRLTQAIANPV